MLWKIAKSETDPVIDYAASELKKYIELIDDDQEVAILSYDSFDPELNSDVLWLGVCPKLFDKVDNPAIDDYISIRVNSSSGVISGTNQRSVLIAVYRFLKELGCYWSRPGKDGEIIPKSLPDTIDVCVDEKPSYRHRGVCIEGAVNYDHVVDMIDWLPKVGMNGYFNQFENPFTFYERWYKHQSNEENWPVGNISAKEIVGLRNESMAQIKKRGLMYHAQGHGWTCEPFGIPGETWDARDYEVSNETRQYLAKVNGKRDLWDGVPLNTNLCYSNKEVRQKIVDCIVEKCKNYPQIDYLHIWLADGSNNHCECEECIKNNPADWYLILLNEADAALTEAGLKQKLVFLIYFDLLWPPVKEKFNNPDRFVLMFAPITRSYSHSIGESLGFDTSKLPVYERNKLSFPKSVDENLGWLAKWQESFKGDSFVFDYHYMWDHFKDPGYYKMAKILFDDMTSLKEIGLNGMVSCQNQRVFFPCGLGMNAMASALWNCSVDFDSVANEFFEKTYGIDYLQVKDYLSKLSELFNPEYIRGDYQKSKEQMKDEVANIPSVLSDFANTIESNMERYKDDKPRYLSWKYLKYHAELCNLYSQLVGYMLDDDTDNTKAKKHELIDWAKANEHDLQHVFDAFEFIHTLSHFC